MSQIHSVIPLLAIVAPLCCAACSLLNCSVSVVTHTNTHKHTHTHTYTNTCTHTHTHAQAQAQAHIQAQAQTRTHPSKAKPLMRLTQPSTPAPTVAMPGVYARQHLHQGRLDLLRVAAGLRRWHRRHLRRQRVRVHVDLRDGPVRGILARQRDQPHGSRQQAAGSRQRQAPYAGCTGVQRCL